MRFVKPMPKGKDGQAKPAKIEDSVMSSYYPALYEYLTATAWEDGKARRTSTLLVFCEDGCFKACVNDRDGGCVAFFASDRWEGLLGAVEEALANGSAEWRAAKQPPGRRS